MEPYWTDNTATLYLGDDLKMLGGIADESVDLVFTSPPYNLGGENSGFAAPGNKTGKWGGGKLAEGYGNHSDDMPHEEYVAWQREVLSTLWRKLTPHGAIFYNHKPRVQDKKVWLPTELNPGLPLRQILIWARPGGVNFSPTHFCPTHEWILVFAKPDYRLKSRGASGAGDVWEVGVEPSLHPAPFPVGLPARAIDASADIALVLDPYCGSGSTLRAASDAGIKCIGIDNDPWCLELTKKRLAQLSML